MLKLKTCLSNHYKVREISKATIFQFMFPWSILTRICEELLWINKKKIIKLIEKHANDLNKHFTEEEIKMATVSREKVKTSIR